jgi:hypothetical protein
MTSRIEARFAQCRAEGRAALVTYVMAGDPYPETSLAILRGQPARALARVTEIAPQNSMDHLIVVNISGRGDKDIPQIAEILGSRV